MRLVTRKYATLCDVRELDFNKVLFDAFSGLVDEYHNAS